METLELLGAAMGLGFVSGINLYATVLAVGLGVNLGLIHLSPQFAGLAVLGEPLVIVVAGALYTVEFFADKVPWLDTAWDSVHTFIRPVGAAWIAAAGLGTVDPALDVAAVLLAGSVAVSTHATKAGLRVLVNASPEPFSNIGLSLVEDVVAVSGAWMALRYPVLTGVLAALFGIAFVVVAPRPVAAVRAQCLALAGLVRTWLGGVRAADDLVEPLPPTYVRVLPAGFGKPGDFALRCVTGRGTGLPPGRVVYACLAGERLTLLGRVWFRIRHRTIELASIDEVRINPGLLFERLTLRSGATTLTLHFFRDQRPVLAEVTWRLGAARAQVTRDPREVAPAPV